MMPIKKSYLLPCLLAGGAMLLAAESTPEAERELFDTTIQHVDMGGLSLSYVNIVPLRHQLSGLLRQLAVVAAKNQDQKDVLLLQAADQFLNLSGIDSLKAAATSLRSESGPGGPAYFGRGYWNTGSAPQGLLYTLFGRTDQPFALWANVPDGATYAAGVHVDFASAWQEFCAQSVSSPELSELKANVETRFSELTGQNLAVLLRSASGEYLLTGQGDPRRGGVFLLSAPDRDGVLLKVLQKGFGRDLSTAPDGTMRIRTESPTLPQLLLVTGNGRLLLTNSPVWVERCRNAGGTNAIMTRSLNAQLPVPGTGIAYAYYNSSPSQLADLVAMWNVPPSITRAFAGDGIHFAGGISRGTDGYVGSFRANTTPATLTAPLLSAGKSPLPAAD